jgi:serine phosphatase RsbU (regulator of sigma subunit)
VIVISASSDLKSVVRGIQLGAEDYLPKPFEPALLKARISSSLEKKHLRDLQQLYLRSLERELEIGREIQQGFLPSELPRLDGCEIAAYFKAAREVAGDFYDVFVLPDGNLLWTVGDVCDKGVGAALFMTLFRSLIRVTATSDVARDEGRRAALTPAERLRHVVSFTNDYVANVHGEASMFATIFIGIFEPGSGVLSYMNCGHEAPLWIREGAPVTLLPRTGPAVGLFAEADFGVKEVLVERGDILAAFTDGIPDSMNGDGEFFGRQRLLEVVAGNNPSPGSLLQRIDERLHEFIGAAGQFDDITLLAIQRRG